MNRRWRGVLIALLVTSALAGGVVTTAAASHEDGDCSYPVTTTDATGTDVTLSEPPGEVVVADAASAQTLWEIGAQERVTGMPVRGYTAYLAGSAERTDVLTEDGSDLAVETIVELDPDLVLAGNPDFHSAATIDQLRAAGVTVYQYPLEQSIQDIYAKTTLYGHLVGECEAAADTVTATRRTVRQIEGRAEGRERPGVLYYFFGFTTGEGTFVQDLVTTAGGENVAARAGIDGFQRINDETIAERDVEWIVTTDDDGAIDTSREPLASTAAVENDRVLVVDADLVSQAGPRVVEPLGRMAAAFHPETTAAPTPTHTPTATDGGMTTAPPTPAPTTADGAGFGVAIAVPALAGGVWLVRQ